MSSFIDLRSDTVTKPVEGMRRAMYAAEVGDDVYGEDPSVIALQERVADLLGKEAALFVPAGTMANQLGLLVHTQRATEVILERHCHIFNHERAAGAWLSGVQMNPLEGKKGVLTADEIEGALRDGLYGAPSSSLICLENTHNLAGGRVQPLAVLQSITEMAHKRKIAMHLDGARLWNASAASGIKEHTYAACFDTVSVCLSKGLGAPVGSLLTGSTEHIRIAKSYRSRLGGSMRQSGILAAAGLYALDHHHQRLAEDHNRAKQLATALSETTWFSVDSAEIETNIVFFDVVNASAYEAVEIFKQENILLSATSPNKIRAVTHLEITDEHLEHIRSILLKRFQSPVTA